MPNPTTAAAGIAQIQVAEEVRGAIEAYAEEKARQRVKDAKHDVEMWEGCLELVAEFLRAQPCIHHTDGAEAHKATPPMMYPEWIACVMRQRVEAFRARAARLVETRNDQHVCARGKCCREDTYPRDAAALRALEP